MTTESRAPEPVGAYPYTRRAGNLLFLSGVGPRQRGQAAIPGVELDADGDVLRYDFESQCRAVFQNVRFILEEAGAEWDDLVKDDFPTYNRLYAEYFATAQPCRTTLEINCLPTPIAIELKCIAALKS
jgi:2-aminomuconate deaminase